MSGMFQISDDPDPAPFPVAQHFFQFSPMKARLHLVELGVEKVSTWPDLVSSMPIPSDLHFVVINLDRNNILSAIVGCYAHFVIKIGAIDPSMELKSPLHNEFRKIYGLSVSSSDDEGIVLQSRVYQDDQNGEGDLEKIRNAKIREEMQDREASLLRAKREASLADGISWGVTEDAIAEDEEDTEEVTWQNHKGQLTERQEKTREKIIKRTQKARDIENMKKEIDAIRSKDISQGGLTQGQQTQIARNEQRISQIFEELESLEETLNDSIRESLDARAGKNRGKRKGDAEEDDEILSDDDDFYDRTKKVLPSQKVDAPQVIETAETLLEKKDAIMIEMKEKRNLLQKEKGVAPEKEKESVHCLPNLSVDELDTKMQLQKDLSGLQSELDWVLYLLKIADPTGEAAKRKELKDQAPKPVESKPIQPKLGANRQSSTEQKKSLTVSEPNEENPEAVKPLSEIPVVENKVADGEEIKGEVFSVTKPRWLGATREVDMKEEKQQEIPLDTSFSDNFVDYKDRKKALSTVGSKEAKEESEIESAGPGLIIRKRKQVEGSDGGYDKSSEILTSSNYTDKMAAESEANLLKHNLGGFTLDSNEQSESIDNGTHPKKEKAKSRRVLGPEKPAFLDSNQNYESWIPPEGKQPLYKLKDLCDARAFSL
ncbi:hypothetical protein Scep_016761 [Stephania cephalantha]|uniref:Uncharacterized protein n=1 Tax=Stephania cephalantha TaxID=152367 RepID=A0AAP0IPK2_9MAGN